MTTLDSGSINVTDGASFIDVGDGIFGAIMENAVLDNKHIEEVSRKETKSLMTEEASHDARNCRRRANLAELSRYRAQQNVMRKPWLRLKAREDATWEGVTIYEYERVSRWLLLTYDEETKSVKPVLRLNDSVISSWMAHHDLRFSSDIPLEFTGMISITSVIEIINKRLQLKTTQKLIKRHGVRHMVDFIIKERINL